MNDWSSTLRNEVKTGIVQQQKSFPKTTKMMMKFLRRCFDCFRFVRLPDCRFCNCDRPWVSERESIQIFAFPRLYNLCCVNLVRLSESATSSEMRNGKSFALCSSVRMRRLVSREKLFSGWFTADLILLCVLWFGFRHWGWGDVLILIRTPHDIMMMSLFA